MAICPLGGAVSSFRGSRVQVWSFTCDWHLRLTDRDSESRRGYVWPPLSTMLLHPEPGGCNTLQVKQFTVFISMSFLP